MDVVDHESRIESQQQREARLRRERRNAKLQAGAQERLNKIYSLSGRQAGEALDASQTSSDPAREEQLLDHFNIRPRQVLRNSNEGVREQTVQAVQQDQHENLSHHPTPSNTAPVPEILLESRWANQSDPISHMLQQFLGNENAIGGTMSPGTEAISKGFDGFRDGKHAGYLWPILHASFAATLALYVVDRLRLVNCISGRECTANQFLGPRLFYTFTIAELVLQSSKYYFNQTKVPVAGLLGMLCRLLPDEYAQYVRTLSHYGGIWTTLVGDSMTFVFILGCITWWDGGAV